MQLSDSIKNLLIMFSPPPEITISEHADKFRYLSQEYCAEPGKYHVSRTEYLREIMDSICEPEIEQTVVMSSARVGKTTFIENVMHYFIDVDPAGGILCVQPTKEASDYFSKVQLSSMIRDNPTLRSKIFTSASDDTIPHKSYPGGSIDIVSAGSPSGLSAKTKRLILCDEVDRYDDSCGEEGDPVSLAIKRSSTFFNRKIILTSTPKVKGSSRIEAAFNAGDKRYYHIPCPHCSTYFNPRWENIKWDKSADGAIHHPETARLECPHCNGRINDAQKNAAVRSGRWIATAESKIRSYHLWEVFSPWRQMQETVTDFLAAKNNSETLKTFVNLSLGESFEEKVDVQDSSPLYNRKENWSDILPANVLVLTSGVDVQDDMLQVQVIGWGLNNQSWIVDYKTILGRPDDVQTWQRLDQLLQRKYKHVTGNQLSIASSFVDSGGHFTSEVYNYCKDKEIRLIYPIKGLGKDGTPLFSIAKSRNDAGVRLVYCGVNNCKSILYSRLKIEDESQNGYIHFNSTLDFSYFEELTAEYLAIKYINGRETREWKKIRARNEALDTYNYALCASEMLDPDFEYLAEHLQPTIQGEVPNTEKQKQSPALTIVQNNNGWGSSMRW